MLCQHIHSLSIARFTSPNPSLCHECSKSKLDTSPEKNLFSGTSYIKKKKAKTTNKLISFFNMKGILQNLTGCCCLVLKWWQKGKKGTYRMQPASFRHNPSEKKKKGIAAYREPWDGHPERESGGVCCLLQPLQENCFRNPGAGAEPWGGGETSAVMDHGGVSGQGLRNSETKHC